jgi:hypothetical protein
VITPDPITITVILFVLAVVDGLLAGWVFLGPMTFFGFFYTEQYSDPTGLFRETGGFWLTFGVIQGIAVVTWERWPILLAVVAGIRFTECLADWSYLYRCWNRFTKRGRFAYSLSVPYTVTAGILMFQAAIDSNLHRSDPGWLFWTVEFSLTPTGVTLLLGMLMVVDLVLAILLSVWSLDWLRIVHGQVYQDPAGLINRWVGIRLSFALTEALAFIYWPILGLWLPVVAGLRLSELLTGLFRGLSTRSLSAVGRRILSISTVFNVFAIITLFGSFYALF